MTSDSADRRDRRIRLGDPAVWKNAGAAVSLATLTLVVAAAYVSQPQDPQDFVDRLVLMGNDVAYGANLRVGRRWLDRAARADLIGADSLAEVYGWRSARNLSRASGAAAGPEASLTANDLLADAYLRLGWRYLERGRGRVFGLGRSAETLEAAERVGACVAGIAPTRRRAAINAFVSELEGVLDRAPAVRCPL
ncbi:MAG: hypothetical protein JSU87_16920 [Gemmatimonadota bacterium]|nr:MAG: hypothetical protein JSU87_16920 [Gemmatimonadota bacterium]